MTDTYAYRVRDRTGKVRTGDLEADCTTLVADKLRAMGMVPLAIDRRSSAAVRRDLHLPGIGRSGGRVKRRDLAVFSRQFATMVDAGLTIMRSLSILTDQTSSPALARVLGEVRADIERGSSLSHALARHPKAFDHLYVAMVRAGEVGGVLDEVLEQLATTIEKQVGLHQKVVSALTYPVAVAGLVVAIVTGMLLFVVPKFETLYRDLGGVLPFPTRVLLGISNGFTTLFPVMVGATVGSAWGFRRWRSTDAGRARWDAITLRVPIFGRLVHKTALTRLARTLAVLLGAGVPVLEALEITSETVDNAVVARALQAVKEGARAGEPLARPLAKHPVVPPMVAQMLAVGEETGAVDTLLAKVGDFYESEVEALVDALASLLEPIMVVGLGITVGSLVLALYLPMFNVIKLIQ